MVACSMVAFVGCGDGVPDYPRLMSSCAPDAGWCPPPGTGAAPATVSATGGPTSTTSSTSSSSAAASSSSGSGATSDLSGTVHRIVATDFSDTMAMPYAGPAKIALYSMMGAEIDTTYGGMGGPSFDAKSVPSGKSWIAVQDQGSQSVWSTVSALDLPQITSVAVPVIDQTVITNIVATLPTVQAKGVSPTLAHVVLLLQHAGAPYKGVKVSSGTGSGVVVYDTGPGTYSDAATATGAAGTVLLFDTTLSSYATITITDPALSKSWPVTVLAGGGLVTLASFDLE
jgi:hypothetical protein